MASATIITYYEAARTYIGPSVEEYEDRVAEWGFGLTLDVWVLGRIAEHLEEGEPNVIVVPLRSVPSDALTATELLEELIPGYSPFILQQVE